MNPIVELQKVCVNYQIRSGVERKVLIDTDLKVYDSDWITISGPSGSGKTTLLKVLADLVSIQSGHIIRSPNFLKSAIYVTQEPSLLRYLTVEENLLKVANGDVTEVMELLNLEKVANSYFDELSGGERVRANLARAIVCRGGGILLLDEPTANLDAKHVSEIKGVLTHLWEGGYTLVVVSHSEELFRMGKRRLLLSRGGLEEV